LRVNHKYYLIFPVTNHICLGDNFITPISNSIKDEMLEKNVVVTSKRADGSQVHVQISSYEDSINLNASCTESNLASYGIPMSIVNTMDMAVQV
jgi:hypothetical protein